MYVTYLAPMSFSPRYDLDGGDGFTEDDGGAWLLPYWIARGFNLIQ